MPMGYPKFMQQGGKNRFIFRCNKFNKTVIFDPYLEVSEEDDTDDSSPPPDHATSNHLNVFMFVALVATFFL